MSFWDRFRKKPREMQQEQDQEQEKQDGRAEENAPATAGFLLFIGRKEQFFKRFALPGGVGSFLLGGVH